MRIMSFVLLGLLAAGPAAAQAPKKTTAAILDLESRGVAETEAAALSERLRSELFQTGAFDMMERGKMQDILQEQGFQQSGACNTNACAVEVGQLIGVEKMIAGSLGKVGKTYSVGLRMVDVRTGRMEQSVTEDYTGEIDKLLTVVMRNIANKMAAAVSSGQDQRQMAPGAMPGPASGGKAFYKKWWFWTGVGTLAAGGAAAAILGGGGDTPAEETPTETTLPLPPNPPQAPVWTGGN
jgi:hypothetical protein